MAKKIVFKTAKELIRDLIVKKKTDAFIIDAVLKAFPNSKADGKHCSKYRRELFNEMEIGPELASANSKAHRDWAKENMAAAKRGPHKDYWKEVEAKAKAAAATKKKAA